MTRAELVASAKRIVRMVDAVSTSRGRSRRRSSYLMLKDYIALAEGDASKTDTVADRAIRSHPSSERRRGLEEAAKICDMAACGATDIDGASGASTMAGERMAARLAKAIRALIPSEGGEEKPNEYEAPRDPAHQIRVRGVCRDAAEPRSLSLALTERPTDDELRALHDFFSQRTMLDAVTPDPIREEMARALEKARVAIATYSPDPTEPLEEIDAALSKHRDPSPPLQDQEGEG